MPETLPTYFGKDAKPGQTEPATIRQFFLNKLFQSGIFENDAETIMDTAVTEMEPYMRDRIAVEHPSAYPQQMLSVLWFGIKRAALAWIDANCPQAWYRELFV